MFTCARAANVTAAAVFAEDAARYGTDSGVYHEAGFDAYATGYAFLKMVHYLHGALSRASAMCVRVCARMS